MTKGDRVLCPACHGHKIQTVLDPKSGKPKKVTCPSCEGTGKRSRLEQSINDYYDNPW